MNCKNCKGLLAPNAGPDAGGWKHFDGSYYCKDNRTHAEPPEGQGLSTHEPPPIVNERTPIQALVIADMKERMEVGKQRYGTYLQAGNGRDALVDWYQELLDAVQYCRQEIEERHALWIVIAERFREAGFSMPETHYTQEIVFLRDVVGAIESARRYKAVHEVLIKERDGEIWLWSSGDPKDGDNAATITCPIMIQPETLLGYVSPVEMILPCPVCKVLHIDTPDKQEPDAYCKTIASGDCISTDPRCIHQANPRPRWANPPHKTHLCAECGTHWRPSNRFTTGVPVSAITRGSNDNLCWEDFTN